MTNFLASQDNWIKIINSGNLLNANSTQVFLLNLIFLSLDQDKDGRDGTSEGQREGGLHHPFLRIEKKCPDFGKTCPVCVDLRVKFSFETQF